MCTLLGIVASHLGCFSRHLLKETPTTINEYHYKSNPELFDSNLKWSDLDAAKVKDFVTRLEVVYYEKNLDWKDMREVVDWKLYQLHKTASRTNKNRSMKQTDVEVGADICANQLPGSQ